MHEGRCLNMWEDLGPQLWPAFWVTIKLTFWSAIGATIWGTILAGMRVSPRPRDAGVRHLVRQHRA